MWSLRWHFTNKSVTGAPYSIKGYSYSLSRSRTLWWRVRWLKQCRLEVAAELQQWWRRTNRRRKSIPRSSSSHREGSITQRGASCGCMTSVDLEALRRRRREPVSMPVLHPGTPCLTVSRKLILLCKLSNAIFWLSSVPHTIKHTVKARKLAYYGHTMRKQGRKR